MAGGGVETNHGRLMCRCGQQIVVGGKLAGLWIIAASLAGVLSADEAAAPAQPHPLGKQSIDSDDLPEKLPVEARQRFRAQMKHRSPRVRAEALAELSGFKSADAAELIFALGLRDPDDDVQQAARRAMAAYKHDRPVADDFLRRLVQLVRRSRRLDPEKAVPLIYAVGAFRFPDLFRMLLGLAESPNDRVTRAALDAVMGSIDDRAAENDPELAPLLVDLSRTKRFQDLYGFRKCVIDAAIRLRRPEAVSFLIGRLSAIRGKLGSDIVRHLERITKESYGPDAARWQAWWKTHRAGFQFPNPSEQAATKPLDETIPYYYNLAIDADRIVFILDTSRSMGAGRPTSRLTAAKRALTETIRSLPENVRFNVIVFNTTVGGFAQSLVPATQDAKQRATAFVARQQPAGRTASYDALTTAFAQDPQLEMIYFLSDGIPSDGTIVVQRPLLAAIRRQNRVRRVTIHAVGVFQGDESPELEQFMKGLARQNYGEYRRVD